MESPDVSRRVGLLYDERMCSHSTPDGESHPESPERLRAIWRTLESAGITKRCVLLEAKEAEEKWLSSVHSPKHVQLVRKIGTTAYDDRKRRILASKFNSIYLNGGSSESAFLAAGSVVQAAEKVAAGELDSAITLVRPPGHHAEPDEMMGFCIFNNVAVAANFLLNERPELGIGKILIVDWDVHHGNGTQKMFYSDPRVLFFSVHRFDFGSFYPAGGDGSHVMTGEDLGAGYNINVPWEHRWMGDADYLAVWDHILIPVAEAYSPDIILISGGFDAAIGDPLGGCRVTPYGYSVMLSKLMRFSHGKIVLALEGGYNLKSIAKSVLACAETLLESKSIVGSVKDPIFDSTLHVLQEVRLELSSYWPMLTSQLPQKLWSNSRKIQFELYSSSESDTEEREVAVPAAETSDIKLGSSDIELSFSNLSIHEVEEKEAFSSNPLCNEGQKYSDGSLPLVKSIDCSSSWRALLSKTDIWYGSYGSNMWMPRFLCYIKGGKVEGMNNPCCGSKDTNLPKDIMWRTVPHCLFFGRSYSRTWGAGGVAFLNPETNPSSKAYICLYKITLEQFNDVLLQENAVVTESPSPLFDATDLRVVLESKSSSLKLLLGGWYSNVLCLGAEGGIPMLTMTCCQTDIDGFKTGALPMLGPSKKYANTLIKGLVEGKQLSEIDAMNYVYNASLHNC